MNRFLRNYRRSVPVGLVVLGALAWVAFGFFGVHKLFVDDKVAEALPSFAAPTATMATTPIPTSTTTLEVVTTSTDAVAPATTVVAATVPATTPTTVPATSPPTPVIATELSGSFVSREHDTKGRAIVLGDGSGQRFLRFEGFATDNGPDLNVYLVNSSTGDVSDFVDLGNLKGNIGDQNYEVSVGTDLEVYDTVVVWCVRFAANFGDAVLAPT